jgi:hypothetical protein
VWRGCGSGRVARKPYVPERQILQWLLEFDRVASDESIRPREKLLILKSLDDKYWGSPT